MEVSLHRFATPAGAAEALPYYVDGRAVALGLEAVPQRPMGDQSAAISGPVGSGTETTVYLRRGALLVRVSAVTADGDSAAVAAVFARLVLRRAG